MIFIFKNKIPKLRELRERVWQTEKFPDVPGTSEENQKM